MPKKIRIKASSLSILRNFLIDAEIDFGCRPVARKVGDYYSVTGVSEDDQLQRLNLRRISGVQIEVLEELPDPAVQLRLVPQTNRFHNGTVIRGLGKKE